MGSCITFLGDVCLSKRSIRCQWDIPEPFVFNMEYVVLSGVANPMPQRVNLSGYGAIREVFRKAPLAVCLANNHTMDYGLVGLDSTIYYLRGEGINYFGTEGQPLVLKVGNTMTAIFGYNMVGQGSPNSIQHLSTANADRLVNDIASARDLGATCIVINMHWGVEEASGPTAEQIRIGRIAIDAGADLVIGHHSHCIQPYEVYKGKFIFYSLGNAVFPDFEVPSFFDAKGVSSRVYRKRQLRWNRESWAVTFDVSERRPVQLHSLSFSRNILSKTGEVTLYRSVHPLLPRLIGFIRRQALFLISNTFVDGRLFDIRAFLHEFHTKVERIRRPCKYDVSD